MVPQESGGRAARNQPYSLLSVTGDAVLLEFTTPPATATASSSSSSGNVDSSGAVATTAGASPAAAAGGLGPHDNNSSSGAGSNQVTAPMLRRQLSQPGDSALGGIL